MEVCAVAAQPGHTKELQSVQLERGLRIIDSPDVIFEDNDSIQGQKESSVLLRNVVKPEVVDDSISVSGFASSPCSSSRSHLRIVTSLGRSLHGRKPKDR